MRCCLRRVVLCGRLERREMLSSRLRRRNRLLNAGKQVLYGWRMFSYNSLHPNTLCLARLAPISIAARTFHT
jgi:hypothetical protein